MNLFAKYQKQIAEKHNHENRVNIFNQIFKMFVLPKLHDISEQESIVIKICQNVFTG